MMNDALCMCACGVMLVALVGCFGSTEEEADASAPPLVWGGPGRTDGLFYQPRAIAHAGGRLYIVDMTGRIQVFDLDGRWRATWRLPKVDKGYPTGLGMRPDGCIAVADTHNGVVRVYNPQGEEIETVGHEGRSDGKFVLLTDVEFDRDGNMYVSEHGPQGCIHKFDAYGRFIKTWGRTGDAPGEFHRPQALAVDKSGCVYVADAANDRIQKFSGDGELMAVWGAPGRKAGQLLYPYDLALTPAGRLLVCEYGNNRIQAFDRDGRSIGIWGCAGREPGRFMSPWGVAWVEGRGMYVVDTGNHRVQFFAAKATPSALRLGLRLRLRLEEKALRTARSGFILNSLCLGDLVAPKVGEQCRTWFGEVAECRYISPIRLR